MPEDAPFTGGFAPGANRFAVDGDFQFWDPDGPPTIRNAFEGDSTPGFYPIVLMDRSKDPVHPAYVSLNLGEGFNVQPFNANQSAIIIEQDFMGAVQDFLPMPLNTPYDAQWGLGWQDTYANLEDCFLVKESELKPLPGGLGRVTRTFANLPQNRNEFEDYNVSFPGIVYLPGGTNERNTFSKVVNTRIFHEYFVWDNLDMLSTIQLFPKGHRLNSSLSPAQLQAIIFEEFAVYAGVDQAVFNRNVLTPATVTDAETVPGDGNGGTFGGNPTGGGVTILATTPSATTYLGWQGKAEIVVQESSFRRWVGNIHVRSTRFAVAL